MLTKRIIPCLDVKDGQTVKGIHFENLREAGDAVELGARYARDGADELVFLDITATNEKRKAFAELVKRIAKEINIPFTVGGGISSMEDVHILMSNGADKVSINSAALKRPELIDELAKNFGSQCVVLAIDVKREAHGWNVFLNGGREKTHWKVLDWVKEAVDRGVGEILLTSMDADGTKEGFDVEMVRAVSELVHVPVIASGGAGKMQDFVDVFRDGKADAALAASIFHFNEMKVLELKKYLKNNGIQIRN